LFSSSISKGSEAHTDELRSYQKWAHPDEYTHKSVNQLAGAARGKGDNIALPEVTGAAYCLE
jgi:hypothetical protein